MKMILLGLVASLSAPSAFAIQGNVCEKAVQQETTRLEQIAEKEDSDYQFDGIGDVIQDDSENYTVTFGYNDECQGGYGFRVKESADGGTCKIKATKKLAGDCG